MNIRGDWSLVESSLDERGYAELPGVLTVDECRELSALYDEEARFRSRIEMARFRFGAGEYKYFDYPLPPIVETLRTKAYARLVPTANRWMEKLGKSHRYPDSLDAFLERCRQSGQTRPTPLLLRYRAGDYNCLHQDLYGELAFPLQVVLALSARNADYTGGEFLLVEQRPRAQSRGEAITIEQGGAVIFANNERPVPSARGYSRVVLRHGVSRIRTGHRMTLGIIFHDAK
jgi:hypothetical protein